MQRVLWTIVAALFCSCSTYAACPHSSAPLTTAETAETVPWSSYTAFAIDNQATQAFAAAVDGTVLTWNVKDGKASVLVDCNKERVVAMDYDTRKKLLAFGDDGGTIHLLSLTHPKPTEFSQQLNEGRIGQVVFGPASNSLLVLHYHAIDLWSLRSQAIIWTRRTSKELESAAISPDGGLIAVNTGDGISLWDPATGKTIRDISVQEDDPLINDVAFTRDNRKLVAAVNENVDIFDIATGLPLQTLRGHTDLVHFVTVPDDGKRVISVGEDDTLREWSLDSGALLSSWTANRGLVTSNGKYLISSAYGSTKLEIWDIRLRKRLQVLTYKSPLDK